MAMPKAQVTPITEEDLPEFCKFLAMHLNQSKSPAEWSDGLRANWAASRPNYGFMLKDQNSIVGGIGAIYADREVSGRRFTTCNITSWCVLDAYRAQSMKLAMSVVGQAGLHFTDFSPTSVVSSSLQFLKFKPLDNRQVILPNVPGLNLGTRIWLNPRDISSQLRGAARISFDDHVRFPWLKHALLEDAHGQCHVIFKRDQVKGLGAARVIHISEKQVFQRGFGALARALLLRGLVFTKVELRQISGLPRFHAIREGSIRKVFLSDIWSDADVDYLYSETVCMDL